LDPGSIAVDAHPNKLPYLWLSGSGYSLFSRGRGRRILVASQHFHSGPPCAEEPPRQETPSVISGSPQDHINRSFLGSASSESAEVSSSRVANLNGWKPRGRKDSRAGRQRPQQWSSFYKDAHGPPRQRPWRP